MQQHVALACPSRGQPSSSAHILLSLSSWLKEGLRLARRAWCGCHAAQEQPHGAGIRALSGQRVHACPLQPGSLCDHPSSGAVQLPQGQYRVSNQPVQSDRALASTMMYCQPP